MAQSTAFVIGGVDTQGRSHHAAVIDEAGRILGSAEFVVSTAGYRRLLHWMRGHGAPSKVGVEGTGTYGAGLCRFPAGRGCARGGGRSPRPAPAAPARQDRRPRRRSGCALGARRDRDGVVESIRALRTARSGAVKARSAALNALHGMVVTAPAELRSAIVMAEGEVKELDAALSQLVRRAAPRTIALRAIGVDHAGQFLITAGERPERLRSEAAFAHLCGAAPIPASSGRTRRHRLHRSGDRAANRALHLAVVVRLRCCPRARRYVERRTAEGLSKPEIRRCLKRYLVREVFQTLTADLRELHGLDGI